VSWSLPTAPLSDIAELNPPLTATLGNGDVVAFMPMSAVDAGALDAVDRESRRYSEVRKGYTPFLDGDVLVAKITPCFENGKIAQARLTRQHGFGSTEFHVVRPHADRADARYLVHYLRQGSIRQQGESRMTGSAGQRRVPEHFLAGLRVPTPSVAEQRRIAAILDKADTLRAKRRIALAQLDVLTQSIFLDMFGDPATNPKRWMSRRLGALAVKFSDGPFGSNLKSEHYRDTGVRVIRLQNIGAGEFVDNDAAFIDPLHFEALKKHQCLPGDVLVGTLGDPNLRACVQPEWLSVALNKADCVQIRADEEVATAAFICALLNQPSTECMANELMHGQTRVRISMGRLREMEVPVPPVAMQREFATRIAESERLRRIQYSSQAELGALFEAIQHRAFRGEL
jgi:type I restriction enzyme S subunit